METPLRLKVLPGLHITSSGPKIRSVDCSMLGPDEASLLGHMLMKRRKNMQSNK